MALTERRLRIGTGLILAVYVVQHLLNHALGLISYDVMDGVRHLLSTVWRNPVVNGILYLCFITHFLLALYSLYRRTTLKMSRWEFMQLTFGLSIVPLLATHATANWGTRVLLEFDIDYYYTISGIFSNYWTIVRQVLLVIVTWLHLCVGLHFWLRLKRWYRDWIPLMYALALLVPILSLIAAIQISVEIQSDDFFETYDYADPYDSGIEPVITPSGLSNLVLIVFYSMLILTLIARWIRTLYQRRAGTFQIGHPTGKNLTGIAGQTILEVIRGYGMPHASVCGGRGRCTTCRVRVEQGGGACPDPNDLEQLALSRISAEPGVRLACQTRPISDLKVTPLVPVQEGLSSLRKPGSVQGTERAVVAMFVDLRGSTQMAEKRLPYDVLFILNRFFAEMTEVLEQTQGHYAQFAGDGLMALYGLSRGLGTGCQDALAGAAAMLNRIEGMNEHYREELDEPLRIGIGIHCGEAIVGTMGPPSAPNYSAIGDNINAAARLEALTKEYGVSVIVSHEVVQNAGIEIGKLYFKSVNVRGKNQQLDVYALSTEVLTQLVPDQVSYPLAGKNSSA